MPRHYRTAATAPLVAALVILASPAYAASSADEAAAEVLFIEGQKLAKAGNFADACPKFEESQRLDAGAGTLLNLGSCYEAMNKLASAFGAFKEAGVTARNAHDAARQAEAVKRADAIEPKLPKLAIVVPPLDRMPGFVLKRNGAVVGEGQWGLGVPVDEGEQTIEASAPRRLSWSLKVTVKGPGVTPVEVPPLPEAPPPPPSPPSPPLSTTQRSAGIVVLSLGAVGLTVGAVAAGVAAGEHSNLIAACPTAVCPPSMQ